MTTRAGWVGIITGLSSTLILFPFFTVWFPAVLAGAPMASIRLAWIAALLIITLLISGGWLAGKASGSVQAERCTVLGALAGGLAGTLIFSLWGAAAAGLVQWRNPFVSPPFVNPYPTLQTELIGLFIFQTLGMFLILFLGGTVLGALGGWLASPRRMNQKDVFDKEAPQMAMNASITAVSASLVAVLLAGVVFPRLSALLGQGSLDKSIVQLPLEVALILFLVSQAALTLVVPHETRQAEHRSGMNEVKMAAYVGIAAAPIVMLALLFMDAAFFSNPWILLACLAGLGMSLKTLQALFKLVLPRRDSFPLPMVDWKKTEANLFGSIANSYGPRLVVLCVGCGLAMVLPIYAPVLSVLINLRSVSGPAAMMQPLYETVWNLFIFQALASLGLSLVTILVLSLMYLFYLNLGRWFSQRNAKPPDSPCWK